MRYMGSHYVMGVIMLLLIHSVIMADKLSAAEVRTTVEPEQIRLGEHARLTFEWTVHQAGGILMHDISDILGDELELIRSKPVDTLIAGEDSLTLRKVYIITSWDDGYHPIRPVTYKHVTDQDTVLMESRAMLLEVKDVEVVMEEEIRDIRPIIPVSRSLGEILIWIFVGAALVIVTYLLYYWIKKRHTGDEKPPKSQKRENVPAHIAAISSLETLRRKQLWRDDKIKQHHIELTDILRIYISKRFEIAAQEMTTGEILHALQPVVKDEGSLSLISDILRESDMVKFARHKPDIDRHEAVIEHALAFISNTLPETDNYDDDV